MAFTPNFVDLVRNYTTTTGTSDFVLGPAVSGFTSFSDACAVGDCFYYSAQGVDNPADTEVGRGTLLAGGAIGRDPINGEKTNFKSGTKAISLIAAAEWFAQANALVGNMSPVGQALVNAQTTADARAALVLEHIAVNPAWYGLVEGDDPAHGAANNSAITAMFADMATTRRRRVAFPAGTYWFSSPIDITLPDLIFEGPSAGGVTDFNNPSPAHLKFTSGQSGIRVQGTQTSGANVKDAAAHAGGIGAVIRNLVIEGWFGNDAIENDTHGIQLRTMATIEHVSIRNWGANGIDISASGGAASGANPPFGNANIAFVSRVDIFNCLNGIALAGSDANACTIIMPNINDCRQWGLKDDSALGNTLLGGNFAANGVTVYNDGIHIPASMVSYGGNRYAAIVGQEAWCGANAPSGTAADNQGWYYISGGAPVGGIPAWFNGILVRAGGCINDTSTAGRGYYAGVYTEADQGKAQLVTPSFVSGGILADWVYRSGSPYPGLNEVAGIRGSGGYAPANIGPATNVDGPFQVRSGNVLAAFGFPQGNALGIAANWMHSTLCPAGYQFQFASEGGADCMICFTYAGGAAHAFWVTTPTTLEQFGTGGAVGNAFCAPILMVQPNAESLPNARRLMIDSAAPSSGAHGQGEWCFYRGPTAGLIGWKCTAAGAPGTWEAVYSGYSSGPVGYRTGAGGVVTQSGSKSAPVALDKLCGRIVMDASSLAAGAGAAFTVNNNEVAATDVIELVLASGNAAAGSYNYQVDSVVDGSFVVWVKNISAGPLGEALIFNFAVKKAVAA